MSNGKEKLEWRTDRKEFQFRCQIRKQHYFWCQIGNFLHFVPGYLVLHLNYLTKFLLKKATLQNCYLVIMNCVNCVIDREWRRKWKGMGLWSELQICWNKCWIYDVRIIFAMKGKKMSSWNDEWVQLPSGECSFLLQWQPCLNKMLWMYYFPWDQSDKCFLSVIMWWITVGTVTTLTPPCLVLKFWWRESIGLTNKFLKFGIQSLLLVLCQTEAPLLFVSWTEMVSISPSRSLRPRSISGDWGLEIIQLIIATINRLAIPSGTVPGLHSLVNERFLNQLDPLYATLSIGFLDGFPAAVLLL